MKALVLKLALGGVVAFQLFSCQQEEIPEETSLVFNELEKVSMTAARHTSMLNNRSDFRLGACGHAIGPESYTNVPIKEQMRLLKSMGMTCYRVAVKTTSTGSSTVPFRFDPMIEAAREAGIKILPMIRPVDLDLRESPSINYERGFKRGRNFAALYKNVFTHYELGNELDNRCIIPGKPGKSVKSYDERKFNAIAAYLKGMHRGVKSQDPDAKTMVDASWLHWGFLRKLEYYGVDFDIVAWHWYDDMESHAKSSFYNIDDISQALAKRFDKPIWFTELGVRYRDNMSRSEWEQRQSTFLKSMAAKFSKNPRVKALLIYELFDEPEKTNTIEKNYGLIRWVDPYTNWERKQAARDLTIN